MELPGREQATSVCCFAFHSDLIVLRPCIEVGEHNSSLLWDDGQFVVLACKLAHCTERVKPHDGDELHFLSNLTAKQLDALEARNAAVLDPDEDLLLEQGLGGLESGRAGANNGDPQRVRLGTRCCHPVYSLSMCPILHTNKERESPLAPLHSSKR